MECRLHSEWSWEPQKVSEWDGIVTRTVPETDEDTAVRWVDSRRRAAGLVLVFSPRDGKPPEGTCLSPCSPALQHHARAGHRASPQQIVTGLHRTQGHFILLWLGREILSTTLPETTE